MYAGAVPTARNIALVGAAVRWTLDQLLAVGFPVEAPSLTEDAIRTYVAAYLIDQGLIAITDSTASGPPDIVVSDSFKVEMKFSRPPRGVPIRELRRNFHWMLGGVTDDRFLILFWCSRDSFVRKRRVNSVNMNWRDGGLYNAPYSHENVEPVVAYIAQEKTGLIQRRLIPRVVNDGTSFFVTGSAAPYRVSVFNQSDARLWAAVSWQSDHADAADRRIAYVPKQIVESLP